MIALVAFIVALVGGLVYGLTDGKVSELGRIAFFVGLFWAVYPFVGRTVSILGGG